MDLPVELLVVCLPDDDCRLGYPMDWILHFGGDERPKCLQFTGGKVCTEGPGGLQPDVP